MLAADAFIQNIHIAHSGTDQRKAHVIVRNVPNQIQIHPVTSDMGNVIKPTTNHHHLLLGLSRPSNIPTTPDAKRELWTDMKMSKSKPDRAVFITDSPDVIRERIKKAFCPPKQVEFNPIIDWIEHLFLDTNNAQSVIERTKEHGGPITYVNIDELKNYYIVGALHPSDVKKALTERLIALLAPVRDHFNHQDHKQLLEEMDRLTITR